MRNKIKEANISMIVARSLGGVNVNALKYLLPLWMSPFTGVTIRLCFATVVFWLISIFAKPDTATTRDKMMLFFLGAFCIYGFMALYLLGLNYSTPVSCAIFSSMQPIWVFILSAIFMHEQVRASKLFGIALGFGAALLCIFTQPSDHLASNALLGNIFNLISSVFYASFLVFSGQMLKRIDNLTMLRYTFLGASLMSLIVNFFVGFHAPVLNEPIHWFPLSVLLFVLVFPTTLTYLLMPIGLKYLNTTLVSVYGYLMLIVATIISLAIGQDRFSWWQMTAIVLMCVSVYWVEIAEKKKEKTKVK